MGDLDAFPSHAVNIMDCVEETLFLVGIEGVILRILLDSLCTFTVYLRFSIYSNQSLVMQCYDLHPPDSVSLAFSPQAGSLHSLPSMHMG